MNTQVIAVLGGLALVGVFAVWNSGRKSVKKAGKGVREVTRMTGTAFRTLITAVVIVAVQWFVIAKVDQPTATWVVLTVPAVFAGATIARLMAVTEVIHTTRGGHR